MTALRRSTAFIFAVSVAASSSGLAIADDNPLLEDAPPRLNYRPLHDGRHMLAPQFGLTLNDPYEQNLLAGLKWRYYFNSWLGLGVDLWAGGGIPTSLTDQINDELSTDEQDFRLSTTSIQAMGNVSVEFVPFAGKAMLFSDARIYFDVHISLGVGGAMISGEGPIRDNISVMPNFGVGIRIFPNRWLSIGLDIHDYMIERSLSSNFDSSVDPPTFGHNWLFGLALGFSFPMNDGPISD